MTANLIRGLEARIRELEEAARRVTEALHGNGQMRAIGDLRAVLEKGKAR